MENEQKLKLPKEARLLEWLLSEDWVIADSHTHVAVDMVEIQRSFVAHFPDAPVPDSGDEKLLRGLREIILESSEEELRDALGDVRFNSLAASGRAIAKRAVEMSMRGETCAVVPDSGDVDWEELIGKFSSGPEGTELMYAGMAIRRIIRAFATNSGESK